MAGTCASGITAAGKGCKTNRCIWIKATNLSEFTIVELSDPTNDTVVALYSGTSHKIWGYRRANINLTKSTVTLEVDSELWPIFATSGLRVRLINRHFYNPYPSTNSTIVTSPTLIWQ